MQRVISRWPALLALVASLLGLTFAVLSASDYSRHLDRQQHDVHCSFIPGAAATPGAENACRVAMYSPYAALLRDKYWGGVPIALFAVGAFSFFTAYALYLLLAGTNAPRRAARFLALIAFTPLFASITMATISWLKLGTFCKTCVGIYISSTVLAVAGIAAWLVDRRATPEEQSHAAPRVPKTMLDEPPGVSAYRGPPTGGAPMRAEGSFLLPFAWALTLAIFTITPALLYVSNLPNYDAYISTCGKLEKPDDPAKVLLHSSPPGAVQPVTLVVDPLCPTCKAFHQRLVAEGLLDKLDITLVLFPLESDCNWMLDRAMHPGACTVAKAILCSDQRAFQVLDWAYENQEDIGAAAKAGGAANVKSFLARRWPGLDACIDAKETKQKLDKTLRWAIANQLPVTTPQMFFGDTRLCDEDTDMGLSFTVRRLSPAIASVK